MQEELNDLVHSILQHGIQLKNRLMRGETLILDNEQAILKRMLLTDADALRWPEYGGDAASGTPRSAARFLGIRYTLVCWLDEIFLVDSHWDTRWNENKLELALYGTNDRGWRFWEQARLAEARQGTDALSACFMCVMLGFRGELGEHPDQLQGWVESCRKRLTQASSRPVWVRPPELLPVTNVPPLRGREGLRRIVFSGGALLLVLFPLLAFFLVLLFLTPRDLPFRTSKSPTPPPIKSEKSAFPDENP